MASAYHFEIASPVEAEEREGPTGPYVRRTQDAWFFCGERYPLRVVLPVPDELPEGYEVGSKVTFSPRSFVTDKYGRLELMLREPLQPVASTKARVAAE